MNDLEKKNLLYQLDLRTEQGLIRRQKHPRLPLLVYSYSDKCSFDGVWDNWTTQARGLVVTTAGEIVGKSLKKFFNWLEKHCPEPPSLPFEIYEKLDGSYLQAQWFNGELVLSTRGSFDNLYVDFAYQYKDYFNHFPQHYTVITEACLPPELDGLQRCVKHDPNLYLLGAIDNYSGKDFAVNRIADNWLGGLPKIFPAESIDSLCEKARTLTDAEGWVLRYSNGFRIKIKYAWYFRLFRAINKLDETVRQGMIEQRSKDEIFQEIPEELRNDAILLYNRLRHYAREREHEILGEVLKNWKDEKKEFAQAVRSHPDRHLLLCIYDDKEIGHILLESADLTKLKQEAIN